MVDKTHTSTATKWPSKYDVLGVEVSSTSYDELVKLFVVAAQKHEPALATFVGVHGVTVANDDPNYRYMLNAFDVAAPDGQPVRWSLNRLHHANLQDRVYGPQMTDRLCAAAAEAGIGVFFYGSTPEVLKLLSDNFHAKYPTLKIDVESPPFRPLSPEENQAVCDRINATGAGFVFIGLGCPRQDIFAYNNRNAIKGIQLCVGAAFDFHAGNKKTAPGWMQRNGLEWLFRLIEEPGRLWKRYFYCNSTFVLRMSRRVLIGR